MKVNTTKRTKNVKTKTNTSNKTVKDKKVKSSTKKTKNTSYVEMPILDKDKSYNKKSIFSNKKISVNTNRFSNIANKVKTKFEDIKDDIEFGSKFSFIDSIKDYFSKNTKFVISLFVNIVLVIALVVVSTLYIRLSSPDVDDITKFKIDLPRYANQEYYDLWNEYHEKAYVPDDYVGQIVFESNLLNQPVVQSDNNETYLQRDFETYQYTVCGPVFIDYNCDIYTDNNTVMYGHNRSTKFDPEHVQLFSPLHTLESKDNYEANRIIYFVLEDRVDVYLVSNVYNLKTVQGDDGKQYLAKNEPNYYFDNYSNEQFSTYISTVKRRELYHTGVEITENDKILTLQTCYENSLDKLIVVAKRVKTLYYEKQ